MTDQIDKLDDEAIGAYVRKPAAAGERPDNGFEVIGRIIKSPTHTELFAALAICQGQLTEVQKSEKSAFGTYAPVENYLAAIRPAMAANDLAFLTIPTDARAKTGQDLPDKVRVQWILTHKSGEWMTGSIHASYAQNMNRGVNALQAMGAVITYLRRYVIQGCFNLASHDDDGAGAGAPGGPEPIIRDRNASGGIAKADDPISKEAVIELKRMEDARPENANMVKDYFGITAWTELKMGQLSKAKSYLTKPKPKTK
jgi:hypothetical protein